MDAAFLAAIPPMKDIHGQQDPTEPPPDVPSGPGGPYLPGTQAPAPTGGGSGDGDKDTGRLDEGGPATADGKDDDRRQAQAAHHHHRHHHPPDAGRDAHHAHAARPHRGPDLHGHRHLAERHDLPADRIPGLSSAEQRRRLVRRRLGRRPRCCRWRGRHGRRRDPTGFASPAAHRAAPHPCGPSARQVARRTPARCPVRPLPARTASAASAGRRQPRLAQAARSRAGRGASAGGRGAADGRHRWSRLGSAVAARRSGGRGASGARSAGAGTGGSRGGRKGEREQTTDRDSLVYDQDWLGDDDVAPGVLD